MLCSLMQFKRIVTIFKLPPKFLVLLFCNFLLLDNDIYADTIYCIYNELLSDNIAHIDKWVGL